MQNVLLLIASLVLCVSYKNHDGDVPQLQLIGISVPSLEAELQPVANYLLPYIISHKQYAMDMHLQLLQDVTSRLARFLPHLEADLNSFAEAAEPNMRFLAMLAGPFYPILQIASESVTTGLTQLISLNVSNSQVSSAGLQHLKSLKNKKSLTLESCKVTANDIKKLQSTNLPNLEKEMATMCVVNAPLIDEQEKKFTNLASYSTKSPLLTESQKKVVNLDQSASSPGKVVALLLGPSKTIVAYGTKIVASDKLHGAPMPEDCFRVSVDEVVDDDAHTLFLMRS